MGYLRFLQALCGLAHNRRGGRTSLINIIISQRLLESCLALGTIGRPLMSRSVSNWFHNFWTSGVRDIEFGVGDYLVEVTLTSWSFGLCKLLFLWHHCDISEYDFFNNWDSNPPIWAPWASLAAKLGLQAAGSSPGFNSSLQYFQASSQQRDRTYNPFARCNHDACCLPIWTMSPTCSRSKLSA
jgi:hypothetical protein